MDLSVRTDINGPTVSEPEAAQMLSLPHFSTSLGSSHEIHPFGLTK